MGLFHIAERAEWLLAEAAGEYKPPSLETEGFIHLSGDLQLLPTAERFFRGGDDLVVLSINKEELGHALRYEEADGDLYPHLYGPLALNAVVEVGDLKRGGDGAFMVPSWAASGYA